VDPVASELLSTKKQRKIQGKLLGVLKRRHPQPKLGTFDRLFWVVAQRVWFGWRQSLIIVTPEMVVRWHRAGFRLYWRLIFQRLRSFTQDI
jgi:hypothetical protein